MISWCQILFKFRFGSVSLTLKFFKSARQHLCFALGNYDVRAEQDYRIFSARVETPISQRTQHLESRDQRSLVSFCLRLRYLRFAPRDIMGRDMCTYTYVCVRGIAMENVLWYFENEYVSFVICEYCEMWVWGRP